MPTEDKDERTWASLLHVSQLSGYVLPVAGLVVTLIIWLAKKDEMPFVAKQGKEILNFQITLWIAGILSGLLCLILVGFVFLAALAVAAVVLPIVAAVRCGKGEDYRYPFIFRFVQ